MDSSQDSPPPASSAAPLLGRSGWLLAALSGVLYGISFPPLALRPLAWIALVPLLLSLRGGSLLRAALLGALWAHVETYVTSDCLPGAVVSYYKQSPTVGWLILEGATLATMVPWYGAFAVAYRVLAQRPGASLPWLAAAAWVACEFLRTRWLGGNPWAVSGYSQVGILPVVQVADLAGVHGISFAIALVNATLAEMLAPALAGGSRPGLRAPWRMAVAPAAVVAGILLYGLARTTGSGAGEAHAEGARRVDSSPILIVQANLSIGTQWREEMYGQNLDTYLRMTWEAGRETRPDLVFWPESALTFFLAEEPSYRTSIARVLSLLGTQLVTGGPREEAGGGEDDPAFFNATFLLSSHGEILGWQDKTKLLPFAEYFPLQSIDLLRRQFGRARQFTPGDRRPPLPTSVGRAGVIVCNEAMFPEPARERVDDGAEFLVNPANDSWFASLKYSLQAFDMVRLRAIEQRRWIVRTSTAGPSAVIDDVGRVVVETPSFERAWTGGRVERRHGRTLYGRVGDAFAIVCLAVAALGLAARWRRGRTPDRLSGLDRHGESVV